NRLATRRFRVRGVDVDLRRRQVHTDGNRLAIHGLLVGASGWQVTRQGARGGLAIVRGAVNVDPRVFPFPHRLEVEVRLTERGLEVATTVVPTGRRRVPVAFGWHPYLRVGGHRRAWRLDLPDRTHLALDALGLPTGEAHREPAEGAPIGARTFDDL